MCYGKEKRDEHGCLVIDESNIHLYTRTIGYVRQNVITHCSGCGKFLEDGRYGPGGLCHECNELANWDDSPGEDYDVGMGIEDLSENISIGLDADDEDDPDVGF